MHDLAFGLRIAGLGMGLIFGLLALLWGGLVLIGRLDVALVAREEAGGARPEPEGQGAADEQLPPEVLAAIAIAVAAHAALVRREAAPTQRAHQPGSQLFASRWLAAGRTRQTRAYGSHGRT